MPGAKKWTAVQDELLEQLMEQHEKPATGSKAAYWQSLAEKLPRTTRTLPGPKPTAGQGCQRQAHRGARVSQSATTRGSGPPGKDTGPGSGQVSQASTPEGPKARSPRNCHQRRSDVKRPFPRYAPRRGAFCGSSFESVQ